MVIHVLMPDNRVRHAFLPEACIKTLHSLGEVRFNESQTEQYEGAALSDILRCADVVMTGWGCPCIGAHALPDDARVKLIVHTGGSVATLVDEMTFARGIRVCTANEIYAKSVAEGTVAYILASLRRIPHWNAQVQQKCWPSFDEAGTKGLLNRSVGLIGYGAIARHLVRMLRPFDVTIRVHADFLTEADCARDGIIKASLDEIAETCDIISLHNSLTPETTGMIGRAFLSKIRDGALFINTARGLIVDEAALADELSTGRFSAVLDVYVKEPLPPDSRLRGLENVLLMPHVAGPTVDRHAFVGREMVAEIDRFTNGEPLRYQIGQEAAMRMTRGG